METALDNATAISAANGGAEKSEYVRQIFSRIAPRYDLLNHVLSLNIDRLWRRRAITRLRVERDPAGIYLDLCAGTLDISISLARSNGFVGTVVGADFAEPMLRAGRKKTNDRSISPVGADALALPFESASMSGAIAAFGVRNVADLSAALREVHRVLKPRGRFVILEFSMPRSRFINAGYQVYFNKVLPVIGGLISGHPTAYRYLPRSVASFPIQDDLARLMKDAGYRSVSWEPLSFGIAAIHVGERPAAVT